MINSRSDYVVAEPPQGITIDGGIMPARDVADDGSWKILRGEDPSFLMEAGLRINAYAGFTNTYPYSGSFPYQVKHELSRQDLEAAIYQIHRGSHSSGSGMYTWPEAPVFISPTYSGTTTGGTSWRYYADALSSYSTDSRTVIDSVLTSATKSQSTTWRYQSWNQNGYDNQLRAARIRDMYYDLNRVKGVSPGNVGASMSGDYTTFRHVHWSPVYNYDADNMAIGLAGAVETPEQWQTSDLGCFAEWYRGWPTSWASYDTDYRFSLGFSNMSIPSGLNPNCTVLFFILTYHQTSQKIYSFPSPGDIQTTDNYGTLDESYDVLAADVSFSNTGEASFDIPSDLVIDLATRNRNLPTQWSGLTFGTSGNTVNGEMLFIGREMSCAVLFYDSGIDFSSLNWVYPT